MVSMFYKMEGQIRVYLVLLLLTLTNTAAGQRLFISDETQQLKKAFQGTFMTCRALETQGETVNIQWYNPAGQLIESNRDVMVRKTGTVLKLILKNLTLDDAGTYTCNGTIGSKKYETSISLKIYRPLNFIKCNSLQQPVINTDAIIKCTATGDPSPSVRWTYKEREIKLSDHYEILPDGLKIMNISEDDNGEYLVEGEILKRNSYEFRNVLVKVTIPPKITQPPVMTNPIEGTDFTLVCKASGKPKPTYTWYKGGQELKGKRIEVDVNTGTLTVREVTRADEGEYKCVAKNIGDEDFAVAQVTVLVPPTVKVPETKKGQEAKAVLLSCTGSGIPRPSLTWQKGTDSPYASGAQKNGRITVVEDNSGEKVRLTLKIIDLEAEDAGNYTCIATNSAGSEEGKTYLSVEYIPVFIHTKTVAYNWMDNKDNITCTAKGLPKPAIYWSSGGQNIKNDNTYKVFKTEGPEQITSYLQVKVDVTNEQNVFTNYTCKAMNHLGAEKVIISLKKAVVPKPPSKVSALDSTPTTITLIISPPQDNGGIDVSQYQINYKAGADAKKLDVIVDSPELKNQQTTTIENLRPKTKYQINVFAGSAVGFSTTSSDLSVMTPEIRKPFDVLITSNRIGSMTTRYQLTWNEPRTGGSVITSYSIQYRMVHIKESMDPWEVDLSADNGNFEANTVTGTTSYLIKNLKAGTFYEIQVIASNNVGQSEGRPRIIFTKESIQAVPTVPQPTSKVVQEPSKDGPDEVPKTAAATGLGSGGVAGLIIALIIIILIVLDLLCYFKFKKGVTKCLIDICDKSNVASGKTTDAEAGASQETTLLTDKQQKEEAEPAGEENKEPATEEGVTDEKKPLKNEDTDDDLKKEHHTDEIEPEQKKTEDIMSQDAVKA